MGKRNAQSAQLYDLNAIRSDNPLPKIVGASVKLTQRGGEYIGCCPLHQDRSPSFTIFAGGDRFHCFGCGASGDVLDFVQLKHNVGLRDAAELLGSRSLPVVAIEPLPEPEDRDTVAEAIAIWRAAVPVSGTLAERYLNARGIKMKIPESIRFAALRYGRHGPEHPCLVALIASVDNRAVGIQRTYLNAAGTGKAAVPKAKLSLGNVKGGAIRLAPAAAELVVAEGLEDALTLQQELGKAAWCAAGAGMLPAMRFPAGVNSVVIGADADEAGEAAAQKAAAAYTERGMTARIIRPLDGFKDFNAELTEGCQ